MNIVMVTTNDPAGTGIQFMRAINQYTEHACRLVTTEIRYNFMFDKDLHVPWLPSRIELDQVLAEADLFHFHMAADEDLDLGGTSVRAFLRGQPIVHHHHGEPAFRADPRKFADRELAQGRKAIVATPDLLRAYPEATWIPNTVPIDDPLYRPAVKDSDRVWVCHTPTRRELKNTTDFIAAMARVRDRHPQAAVRLIEHTTHKECLARKRRSSILFDHMQGYFGVSSLEALSQGVPTIAGLDAWNQRHLRSFTESDTLPFVFAYTLADLEQQLDVLIADEDRRNEVGRASRAFMERHWTPRIVAERLVRFYESV